MIEPFILFKVSGTTYAVRSAQVQSIEMIDTITHVPNTPEFVEGVVYLRGVVVPVINLRRRFKFDPVPFTTRSRLVVIRLDGRTIGLAVDEAREFTHLETNEILSTPETLVAPDVRYLEGVVSRGGSLILVILLPELFNFEEKQALSEPSE
jgi:purine-binding chemotaxis protein CheW